MASDLPKKAEYAAESDAIRAEVVKDLQSQFILELDKRGLDEVKIAKKAKEFLDAKKVVFQKLKGALPQDLKLPRGYKIITPTQRLEWFNPETGQEVIVDPGETLLTYTGPDYATQQKAFDALLKIRGIQGADKHEHKHAAAVIHLHHHVPEPDPRPAAFKEGFKEDGEID